MDWRHVRAGVSAAVLYPLPPDAGEGHEQPAFVLGEPRPNASWPPVSPSPKPSVTSLASRRFWPCGLLGIGSPLSGEGNL